MQINEAEAKVLKKVTDYFRKNCSSLPTDQEKVLISLENKIGSEIGNSLLDRLSTLATRRQL